VEFLRGLNLSASEQQDEIQNALSQCDQTSPQDGRVERLLKTEVELGLLTPVQSQEKKALVEAQMNKLQAQGSVSQQDLQNAIQETVTADQGAQFVGAVVGFALLGGVGVAGIAYFGEKLKTNQSNGTMIGLFGSIMVMVIGFGWSGEASY
jgi:hypothetical protein